MLGFLLLWVCCQIFFLPQFQNFGNRLVMIKTLLGKKIGMSQIFDQKGTVIPVTFIEAGPVTAIKKRTSDKDGYSGLQVGFGVRSAKRVKKPQKGEFKDLGMFKYVREFRFNSETDIPEAGTMLDVSVFKAGDTVKISGVTKSKGFQGVVKRHGFAGHNSSHGTKHAKREPGTIGGGLRTRVPSGMRMAGRMGGTRVTVRGLSVVAVDAEKNILIVKGAVPGFAGRLLEIKAE